MEQNNTTAPAEDPVFGPVISSYTRAQAIADGVLVDISKMAAEAGFRYPVALTSTLYGEWIVADEFAVKHGESMSGRLWDCLYMLLQACKRLRAQGRSTDQVLYQLYFTRRGHKRLTTFKSICGPGDNREPVITIMLPNED